MWLMLTPALRQLPRQGDVFRLQRREAGAGRTERQHAMHRHPAFPIRPHQPTDGIGTGAQGFGDGGCHLRPARFQAQPAGGGDAGLGGSFRHPIRRQVQRPGGFHPAGAGCAGQPRHITHGLVDGASPGGDGTGRAQRLHRLHLRGAAAADGVHGEGTGHAIGLRHAHHGGHHRRAALEGEGAEGGLPLRRQAQRHLGLHPEGTAIAEEQARQVRPHMAPEGWRIAQRERAGAHTHCHPPAPPTGRGCHPSRPAGSGPPCRRWC
jgi:hypothetical protein